MVTGATERHDMVTGVTEEVRNGRDMVTAVQEEIPYCSPGYSSGKQKKARSTSQPQFRSENTPATIEADQILLAFQQLATNSSTQAIRLRLACKIPWFCKQNYPHLQAKIFLIAFNNTPISSKEVQNNDQSCYHTASKFTQELQVS